MRGRRGGRERDRERKKERKRERERERERERKRNKGGERNRKYTNVSGGGGVVEAVVEHESQSGIVGARGANRVVDTKGCKHLRSKTVPTRSKTVYDRHTTQIIEIKDRRTNLTMQH